MSAAARLLVVDDTPMNLKLLEGVLTGHGYAVSTAASGPAALEAVRADCPDLVLLDVVMPEMSGYDVCRRLRTEEATRLLPVIMVTALDPATERVKGMFNLANSNDPQKADMIKYIEAHPKDPKTAQLVKIWSNR